MFQEANVMFYDRYSARKRVLVLVHIILSTIKHSSELLYNKFCSFQRAHIRDLTGSVSSILYWQNNLSGSRSALTSLFMMIVAKVVGSELDSNNSRVTCWRDLLDRSAASAYVAPIYQISMTASIQLFSMTSASRSRLLSLEIVWSKRNDDPFSLRALAFIDVM